jgi:hypothetical protein
MSTVILPAVISAIVSWTIMYFGPRFNFNVWKKQKRKEQQLAIADHFAKIIVNPYNMGYDNYDNDHKTWLAAEEVKWERMSVLTQIAVLFERPETRKVAKKMNSSGPSKDDDSRVIALTNLMMFDLAANLFAEALDLPSIPTPSKPE